MKIKYTLLSGLALTILVLSGTCQAQINKWRFKAYNTSILSSPHTVDLNLDGVLDIVVGGGVDGAAKINGIMAINGATGASLWTAHCLNELFGSAVFLDITNDNIPDVFISGRANQLYAMNGANGSLIWQYVTPSTPDDTIMNIYSPQIIKDQTGDNIPDLLISNGGQHDKPDSDQNRRAGLLKIINSINGNIVAQAKVPDLKETYCSPLVFNMAGTDYIVYGTGGEIMYGHIFIGKLANLKNNSLSGSTAVVQGTRGFIAPPSLADLTGDGIPEIIAQCFDGSIYAFDIKNPLSPRQLWKVDVGGMQSHAECTIGNFVGDATPDVFGLLNTGVTPYFTKYNHIVIDGATGQYKLYTVSDISYASSSAIDINGDGKDEAIVSLNNMITSGTNTYYQNKIKSFDFANNTITDLVPPSNGYNLSSTPWVGDIDKNNKIDIVWAYRIDSSMNNAELGISVKRFELNNTLPTQGIAWGSYMGTPVNISPNSGETYNGIYVIVNGVTAIGKTSIANIGLSVYPNPSEADIIVEVDNSSFTSSYTLSLFDNTGRLVKEFTDVYDMKLQIKKQEFKPGVYQALLRIENTSKTFKIVFIE